MRTFLIISLVIAGLLLMPLPGFTQSEQATSEAPPVAQSLVREGDLAIRLVDALKLGTAQNEAEAETMLASSGIAPRNGWIADYPVTPDIIGELETAVETAADSRKLPMGKGEALKKLQTVTAEFGLPVVSNTSGQYAQNSAPATYTNPAAVDDYYSDYGPPVVTYYPPPPDYDYMYAWVPYPFWFGDFFFTGFFCLHDFDRIVFVNRVTKIITNHRFDQGIGKVTVIDPVKRIPFQPVRDRSGFGSIEARRGADRILGHSMERSRSGNVERGGSEFNRTPAALERSPGVPSVQGRTPAVIGESGINNSNRTSREDPGSSFSRRGEMTGRGGREFNSPPGKAEGSFSTPNTGRSFSSPSVRQGNPSTGFNSGSAFSGGSRDGGAGRAGLSGGFRGGVRGCVGRC